MSIHYNNAHCKDRKAEDLKINISKKATEKVIMFLSQSHHYPWRFPKRNIPFIPTFLPLCGFSLNAARICSNIHLLFCHLNNDYIPSWISGVAPESKVLDVLPYRESPSPDNEQHGTSTFLKEGTAFDFISLSVCLIPCPLLCFC